MIRSNVYDYSDTYFLVELQPLLDQKMMMLQNCMLFTDCISNINNTEIDNAKGYRCFDATV